VKIKKAAELHKPLIIKDIPQTHKGLKEKLIISFAAFVFVGKLSERGFGRITGLKGFKSIQSINPLQSSF
jgi:hypothetical protein